MGDPLAADQHPFLWCKQDEEPTRLRKQDEEPMRLRKQFVRAITCGKRGSAGPGSCPRNRGCSSSSFFSDYLRVRSSSGTMSPGARTVELGRAAFWCATDVASEELLVFYTGLHTAFLLAARGLRGLPLDRLFPRWGEVTLAPEVFLWCLFPSSSPLSYCLTARTCLPWALSFVWHLVD
jgi:hypothetical protein